MICQQAAVDLCLQVSNLFHTVPQVRVSCREQWSYVQCCEGAASRPGAVTVPGAVQLRPEGSFATSLPACLLMRLLLPPTHTG